MENEVIIGIDLAGKPENPTGWAIWKNKELKTTLLYSDGEILDSITRSKPKITAIDAPFCLPKKRNLQKSRQRNDKAWLSCLPSKSPRYEKTHNACN